MRKLNQFRRGYAHSDVVRNDYFAFQGALNLVDSPLTVAPGQLLRVLNYEPFVNGGYRSLGGFERFDGRPAPSAVRISRLLLDTISDISVIEPGHTLRWNDGADFATVLEVDPDEKTVLIEGAEIPPAGAAVFIQQYPWLRKAERHHLTFSKNGSPLPGTLQEGFWMVNADTGALLSPNNGVLRRSQRRINQVRSLDMHPQGRLYAGAGEAGSQSSFAVVDRMSHNIEGRPVRENDWLPDQRSNVVRFSTDGTRLIVGDRDRGFQVYETATKGPEDGWPSLAPDNTLWDAQWSLDGRWLAVATRRTSGRFTVHVLDVNSKEIIASSGHNTSQSDGAFSMVFTPAGNFLVYAIVTTGINTTLRRMALPSGAVTINPPGSVTTRLVDMAISPDGQQIIFARSQEITPGKVWVLNAPFSGFPIPYGLATGGVIDLGDAISIAWSPDGDQFGVGVRADASASPGYLVFNTDGSRDVSFASIPSDWARDSTDITWAWSPMTVDAVVTDIDDAETLLRQLREERRAAIEPVPGTGPVRGVQYYDGDVYAFRDGEGDDIDTGVMWRSSPNGWVRVAFDKILEFQEGTQQIHVGDIIRNAEDEDEDRRYEVLAVFKQRGFWQDEEGDEEDVSPPPAEGYLVYRWPGDNPISEPPLNQQWNEGDTITVVGNLDDGDLDEPVDAAEAAGGGEQITLTPGDRRYEFVIYNLRGHDAHPLLYGVDGTNNAFEFDSQRQAYIPIRTGMDEDTPTHLTVHNFHLFLSFPGGSIQNSETNEPYGWALVRGANEIVVGTECVGFLPEQGGALLIFGRNRNHVLFGDTNTNFQLQTLSFEVGAVENSIQRIGQGVYLDRRGFTSVRATSAFGDFISNSLSFKIQPFIDENKALFQGGVSQISRKLSLYRYWLPDGRGISLGFAGHDPTGFTFIDYGKPVRCVSMASDGQSEERLFFGSDDGFVYEQDVGTSFDGEPITGYLSTVFNHSGGPSTQKQYRKMSIDVSTQTDFEVWAGVQLNFAEEPTALPFHELIKQGKTAVWNEAIWNQFLWSTGSNLKNPAFYVDAAGYNAALHVYYENEFFEPHVLSGAHMHWSPRRLKREF